MIEGNLVADALLRQATEPAPAFGIDGPDVTIQTGGGLRNDEIVPVGPITELLTFDILPFSNFVVVVDVSRHSFQDLLEHAVAELPSSDGRFARVVGLCAWGLAGRA